MSVAAQAKIEPQLSTRVSRECTLIVWGLGLATLAVYWFGLTQRFFLPQLYDSIPQRGGQPQPTPFDSGLVTIAAFVAVFVLYATVLLLIPRTARISRSLQVALWLLPLTYALALVLTYPIGSGDVMDYIIRGWQLNVRGLNPYVVAPAAVSDDPFLKYSAWSVLTSSYGPLWELIGGGISKLAGVDLWANLIAFKGLAVLSHFANALLIDRLLRQHAPTWRWRGLAFYLWNPLVLFDAAANAHNDLLMLTGVLLAFVALDQPWAMGWRYLAASVALALATLIKAPALVLLPLFWLDGWRQLRPQPLMQRVAALLLAFAATTAVIFVFYLPFAEAGRYSLLTMLQSRSDYFTTSIPNALKLLLQNNGVAAAASIARNLALGAFVAFYLWQAGQLYRARTGLVRVVFEVFFFLLLFSTLWFQPWYVSWLVALAALIPAADAQVRTFVFSLTATAKYIVWWMLLFWLFGNDRVATQWASVYIIYGLPLLVSLGFVVAQWRQQHNHTASIVAETDGAATIREVGV